MDDVRFDALARVFGSEVDRRATARALVGGALASLGLAAGPDAEAKKKKKKKPTGCQFTKPATLWTLQADCTATEAIIIPDGVALDGNNKTIRLAPACPGEFRGPGVTHSAGTDNVKVRNLTIDGSGLTGACTIDTVPGINFFNNDGGEIQNVTVNSSPCGDCVTIAGEGTRKSVALSNLTVRDAHPSFFGGAIAISGPFDATFVGGAVRQTAPSRPAIRVGGPIVITIDDVIVEDADIGIEVLGSQVIAQNNALTDVEIGLAARGGAPSLQATNNSIVGRGSVAGPTHGVGFEAGSSGSASGNTISNFFDSVGAEGCGIFVAEDAGAVTIGANTFPAPPGNEQDVCDNRP